MREKAWSLCLTLVVCTSSLKTNNAQKRWKTLRPLRGFLRYLTDVCTVTLPSLVKVVNVTAARQKFFGPGSATSDWSKSVYSSVNVFFLFLLKRKPTQRTARPLDACTMLLCLESEWRQLLVFSHVWLGENKILRFILEEFAALSQLKQKWLRRREEALFSATISLNEQVSGYFSYIPLPESSRGLSCLDSDWDTGQQRGSSVRSQRNRQKQKHAEAQAEPMKTRLIGLFTAFPLSPVLTASAAP